MWENLIYTPHPPELMSFHPKAKKLEISVSTCGLIMGKRKLPRRRFKPWKKALGSPFPLAGIPESLGVPGQWDSAGIFTLQTGTLRAVLGGKEISPGLPGEGDTKWKLEVGCVLGTQRDPTSRVRANEMTGAGGCRTLESPPHLPVTALPEPILWKDCPDKHRDRKSPR